ncbi:unnamed protein product [marine sediment metagenome]|uniref:Uncharacterized protein n=1 Tax=marine sediment metagenome TaxID=412755 RepID=X0X0Q9_9ZZZZ
MPPQAYEIRCNICNGANITWSEYEEKIWCYNCKKDTPGTGGIFGGPVPIEVSQMFGISFDRIDLKTKKRLYMKRVGNKFIWEAESA